ncbi:hypothetical protein [Kitasatospora purpeofusca]|uniref:hypothetical protein n=1 Tax=Kitasatospora purpeofusca TaxID=67352 RepID=UPI002A59E6BF|nr:hypothetical protein [Kitasatospora purpeofusca]MDY0810508.1 hypothetical protein [Kitasatospora purpeofusca]
MSDRTGNRRSRPLHSVSVAGAVVREDGRGDGRVPAITPSLAVLVPYQHRGGEQTW